MSHADQSIQQFIRAAARKCGLGCARDGASRNVLIVVTLIGIVFVGLMRRESRLVEELGSAVKTDATTEHLAAIQQTHVLLLALAGLAGICAVLSMARASRALAESRHRATESSAALWNMHNSKREIVNHTHDVIITVDSSSKVLEFNPAAEAAFGYSSGAIIGKDLFGTLIVERRREKLRRDLCRSMHEDQPNNPVERTETIGIRRDGTEVHLEGTIVGFIDKRRETLTMILHDCSGRKQWEKELEYHAFHDEMTGLPNRACMIHRLDQLIWESETDEERQFAVILLGLDRFKNINDSLGRAAGDKVVIETARRLLESVDPDDTVARLGGDEFAVLVSNVKTIGDVIGVAERVRRSVSRPFAIDDRQAFTTASVGIALSEVGYEWAEDILHDADAAMYHAKVDGKDRHAVFTTEMRDRLKERGTLESDLRTALENEEFRVFYQPIVSLSPERLTGFEALVRWQHPERGILLPGNFLDIAEETGMITQIGWWVLGEACRQLRQWQNETPAAALLTISVNVSTKQIVEPDFVEKVINVINESRIDPGCLTLEVTEQSVISNVELAAEHLSEVKETGIHLSIDDFGTGNSSLSQLRDLPFDLLKIDRSFVGADTSDKDRWQLVRSSIELAHNLNMRVVGEGVETPEQLDCLANLQCDSVQGYLFAAPVDHEAARTLIRGNANTLQGGDNKHGAFENTRPIAAPAG